MSSMRFDEKTGEIIREERVRIGDATNTKDMLGSINNELAAIVRKVKNLKARAEELKSMKVAIEEKAGPIDPAPDPKKKESQLSPAG